MTFPIILTWTTRPLSSDIYLDLLPYWGQLRKFTAFFNMVFVHVCVCSCIAAHARVDMCIFTILHYLLVSSIHIINSEKTTTGIYNQNPLQILIFFLRGGGGVWLPDISSIDYLQTGNQQIFNICKKW